MRKYSRIIACVLLSATAQANADISYSQYMTVEVSGAMSLYASEGTVLTQIAGDKARIENNVQMKSRLARTFMGNSAAGSIVRLDKGLVWNLDTDKRQYTEQSFAELRAQRQKVMDSMEQSGQQGGGLPITSDGCQWSESEVEFERPRGKETVAGLKASKNILKMHQSCRDPGTGNTCELSWIMETWMAKKVPAEKEARAFRQSWAEALGLGESMSGMEGPGAALVAMFSANWEELAAELEQVKGYPLRSLLKMEIGGEQCKTASGQAIAMDEMWGDASTAAYNAALDQTGSATGSAIGTATAESLGGGVGGSIGGAAIGAATGELIGGLTGMFKKKKPSESRPQTAVGDARVTVFTITSEVTDWSEITIPDERFEAPAGWKKM